MALNDLKRDRLLKTESDGLKRIWDGLKRGNGAKRGKGLKLFEALKKFKGLKLLQTLKCLKCLKQQRKLLKTV